MKHAEHSFALTKDMRPAGDQPEAIKKLIAAYKKGEREQTLLGVTGSGKTFTMANVIQSLQKPALVLAHNKTLAAQLYEEFKTLFPKNRVEYFVSYYDFYQPESYIPQKDQYIEKDAQINQKIEQMRLAATASLMSRNDTIVVSSVSCIYGLGNPENFRKLGFELEAGEKMSRDHLIRRLIAIQFERNETELMPGRFRAKGDTIDFIPGYYNNIIRVELFGEEIERILEIDKNTGEIVEKHNYFYVYPARHFVIEDESIDGALEEIKEQLKEDLPKLDALEAHRLKQRTLYDLEMIKETGYCKGIENYSRHFEGRKEGEPPFTLLDYFPDDFMLIIDESHQTLPQIRGMYNGDYARKKNLIEYGFRLSSAFDNRPLKFDEFEKTFDRAKTLFVSATPGEYEKKNSGQIVEQIIRPTGLVDPIVETHPITGQVKHLIAQVQEKIKAGERTLVTTLTKKLAEELADYLAENNIKTRYMHADIDTLERTELIRELRLGKFDVLVGINLLREGLDIPEVGLVAILDADKEGFLRDERSLIQTIGRAARNVHAKVILYADVMTQSIVNAMEETQRRRQIQIEYNKKHKITPKTIVKPIREREVEIKDIKHIPSSDLPNLLIELNAEMETAAEQLNFERAIVLREKINQIKRKLK